MVDWLTGEVADGSSLKSRSAEFSVERGDGHAKLAAGFEAWLGARSSDGAIAAYWLQHGVVHLCRADGTAARAAEVYATDLAFLRQRLDAGHLAAVSRDYVELSRVRRPPPTTGGGVPLDLAPAAEVKALVGKHRSVLQSAGGGAVLQL